VCLLRGTDRVFNCKVNLSPLQQCQSARTDQSTKWTCEALLRNKRSQTLNNTNPDCYARPAKCNGGSLCISRMSADQRTQRPHSSARATVQTRRPLFHKTNQMSRAVVTRIKCRLVITSGRNGRRKADVGPGFGGAGARKQGRPYLTPVSAVRCTDCSPQRGLSPARNMPRSECFLTVVPGSESQ